MWIRQPRCNIWRQPPAAGSRTWRPPLFRGQFKGTVKEGRPLAGKGDEEQRVAKVCKLSETAGESARRGDRFRYNKGQKGGGAKIQSFISCSSSTLSSFPLNTPQITQIHILIKSSCLQSKNKHVFLLLLVYQGDDAAAAAENMAESPDVTDPAEATEVRLTAAYEALKLQSATPPAETLTYACASSPFPGGRRRLSGFTTDDR